MKDNSVAILATNKHPVRNNDAEYPFRTDSSFYYLTGLDEPDSIAVFSKKGKKTEFTVFCRPRNPDQEIWTGRRLGTEGVVSKLKANKAYKIDEFVGKLPELLVGSVELYLSLGRDCESNRRVMMTLSKLKQRARSGTQTPQRIHDLDQIVNEMRLIKSPAEQNVMRKAAKIAAKGHIAAMQACKPGMKEFEVQAPLEQVFRENGCECAYTSIVGGGENACILHYVENKARLNNNELLLIDAGAELDYYASDITRTFPTNGKFNAAQKEIYELVLRAQLAAIRNAKPGKRWDAPHKAAVRVLTEGLVALKLLKGKVADLIKNEEYRRFYMHNTGHWLGMDVHDVGNYKPDGKWRVFKPGMVLTVEPGLYIPAKSKGVPKRYWDIGVRIEDDVLITRTGNEILSKDVPKSVAEIEALMAQ